MRVMIIVFKSHFKWMLRNLYSFLMPLYQNITLFFFDCAYEKKGKKKSELDLMGTLRFRFLP